MLSIPSTKKTSQFLALVPIHIAGMITIHELGNPSEKNEKSTELKKSQDDRGVIRKKKADMFSIANIYKIINQYKL